MKRRRFLALAGYGLAAAAALPVVVAEVLEPPEAELEPLGRPTIADLEQHQARTNRLQEWSIRPCEDDVQLPLVEVRR